MTEGTTTRDTQWFIASVIAGCLAILATFLLAPEKDLQFFFVSDTLYLPSIYRDIFVEGNNFLEWYLNPAPNFFPDMGLYCLLNALLGNFRLASYAYPMVQFAIIAVLFRAIARESGVMKGDGAAVLGTLLLALVALTGWWGGDFGFAFHLLVNSFHAGAFVNALLCTWLLLRSFAARRPWIYILLGLFTALASASDKLFWVMFTAPAVITCVLLATRKQVRWSMLLTAIFVMGSTWLGDSVLRWLDEANPLWVTKPYAYLEFDRIVSSWEHFVMMLRIYLGIGAMVATTLVLGLVVTLWAMAHALRSLLIWFRSQRNDPVTTDLRPITVRWMIGMFFPFVLLAPVLNGSFDGMDSLRYNFAVFMLAPLVTGVVLYRWGDRFSKWPSMALLVVVALPALWVCMTRVDDYRRIATYKPERVREMDRLARGLALRNGVGDYQDAKVITMFTGEDLTVLPVFQHLAMYLHVNREGMFNRSGPDGKGQRSFDHVVLSTGLPKEEMIRLFGQDTGFHASGRVEVMLTPQWSFDPATRLPVLPTR
jgi:hypothetical protein